MKPIVLIGFMGTFKTSSGKATAEAMGFDFADTDEMIEQTTGKSIAFIFKQLGESGFRLLELAAVRHSLLQENKIVSLGGGAVLTPDVRLLLQEKAYTIWLTASAGEIQKRLKGDTTRPLLQSSTKKKITSMLEERDEHYRSCAQTIINTDGLLPEQIAQEICVAVQLGSAM